MTDFQREVHNINGINVVMYVAGEGEPLLYLHGAGTFHGFEFAKQWADKFRVLVPYHPGFGESDDDPTITDMHAMSCIMSHCWKRLESNRSIWSVFFARRKSRSPVRNRAGPPGAQARAGGAGRIA